MNEQFGIDNITVVVGWSEQDGVLDNLIILPRAIKISNGSTNVVLTIHYNILYNISIIISLCGQVSINTLVLNYGEFDYH